MDELLSDLDAELRVQTRTQIAELQRRLGVTTVDVSRDQVEAMTMAERVAVLEDGVLQHCASPRELFTRPTNVFVAARTGSPEVGGLDAHVDPVEELGSESYLCCTAAGMNHQEVIVRTEGLSSVQRGDEVSLLPQRHGLHLFDAVTGERLPEG